MRSEGPYDILRWTRSEPDYQCWCVPARSIEAFRRRTVLHAGAPPFRMTSVDIKFLI